MTDQEGLRLETELELKNVELEIKEIEVEMYRNRQDSIKIKEEIDKLNIPEDELKSNIDFLLSGAANGDISNNYGLIRPILAKIGALTYKNYCLEVEKSNLSSYMKDLQEQLRKMEEGVKFKWSGFNG